MREIKFRAWDLLAKEMRHVSFLEFDAASELCNVALPADPINNRKLHAARFDERTNGEFLDLMQYTGLKDKNGKKIYEGDVIEFWSYTADDGTHIDAERHPVTWMSALDYPAFDLDGCDHESNMLSELIATGEWEWEIIGNIYENPELLSHEA